jgi:hypothetical protein
MVRLNSNIKWMRHDARVAKSAGTDAGRRVLRLMRTCCIVVSLLPTRASAQVQNQIMDT